MVEPDTSKVGYMLVMQVKSIELLSVIVSVDKIYLVLCLSSTLLIKALIYRDTLLKSSKTRSIYSACPTNLKLSYLKPKGRRWS